MPVKLNKQLKAIKGVAKIKGLGLPNPKVSSEISPNKKKFNFAQSILKK